MAEPVDLLAQRLHLTLVAKRIAEEVAERGQQTTRRARVLGGEPGDGVERVEQEVRLEMRAQPRQLRRRAKLLRLERAEARVFQRKGEDESERPEPEVGQAHREPDAQRRGGCPLPGRWPQHRDGEAREVHHLDEHGVERSGRKHPDQEHNQRSRPAAFSPAKAARRSPEEDGQPDEGDGELGEHAAAVAGSQVLGGELQQGHDGHHGDSQGSAPAGDLGNDFHASTVAAAALRSCGARRQQSASRRHFAARVPRAS